MSKLFLVISLLMIVMIGCGGDDSDCCGDYIPVFFVSASPPGGCISSNAEITVTFDGVPRDVTVSAGTVTVAGNTATITGPFTPGPLQLSIAWVDFTLLLNYTVNSLNPCN